MPTHHDKQVQDLVVPPIHSDEDHVDWIHPGYINRPLATPYTFPGRGNQPHGLDNTTKTADYSPDLHVAVPLDKRDPHLLPDYEQVRAPKPLAVTVVSQPMRSYLVETKLIMVLQVGIAPVGGAGAVMLNYSRQLVGYDDNRDYFTINMAGSYLLQVSPSYVPCLSTDPGFNTFYVLGSNTNERIEGKSAWYVAPLVVGSGSAPVTPYTGIVVTKRLINTIP